MLSSPSKVNLISLTLFGLLLFPDKFMRLYVVLATSLLLLIPIIEGSKARLPKSVANPLNFIGIFFMATLLVSGIAIGDGYRDLYECLRILLFIAGFRLMLQRFDIPQMLVLRCLLLYLTLDLLAVLAEEGLVPGRIYVENLFHSDARSLRLSGVSNSQSRFMGLSSGPGQHGALLFLVFCYFLGFFFAKQFIKSSVIGIVLAGGLILKSQSQTCVVALVISFLFLIITSVIKWNNKWALQITVGFIAIIAIFGGYFLMVVVENFAYLASFLDSALERSSYKSREIKWLEILSMASESPWFYLTGFGKSYFGELSTAMDNEHLYILLVYGVFGSLIFYFFLVMNLFRSFSSVLGGKVTHWSYSKLAIFIGGAVIAWPSSFFTNPKTFAILSFLFYISPSNDRK